MAVLSTLVVTAAFTLFAVDEMGGASQRQQAALAAASTTPGQSTQPTQPAEPSRSGARATIEDANDVLLGPFAGIAQSSTNPWVERGVPTLLALALYGAGLGYLARYVRSRT